MKFQLLLLLALFAYRALGQLQFEGRLEIDLKEDEFTDHKTFMFGENGFVIRSIEKNRRSRSRLIKYESFNNQLTSKKELTFSIDAKPSMSHVVLNTQRHIVELVYHMSGNAKIIVFDAVDMKTNSYPMDLPKGYKYVTADFAGNYAVFVMNDKRAFHVVCVDVFTGQYFVRKVEIESVKAKNMTLESISPIDNGREVIVSIDALDRGKKNSGKRTNNYLVFVQCATGNYKVVDINQKIENTLLSVSGAKTEDGKYIIAGTYMTKSRGVAEGLFISEIDQGKVNYVEYTGFSQLKEFTAYLPKRTQERLEKRKKRRESAGKEVVYAVMAVNHPVYVTQDAYYVLAEFFYPTYYTQTTTGANGQTITRRVFDGYQYTHASFVKYDKEGKMQWDRTFELWPSYKPFVPIRFISFAKSSQKNYFSLVYSSHRIIVSKGVREDGVIEYNRQSENIETAFSGDIAKYSFADVDYWYDNFFMLHGVQRLKNTSGETKRKRDVYFVSKVRF